MCHQHELHSLSILNHSFILCKFRFHCHCTLIADEAFCRVPCILVTSEHSALAVLYICFVSVTLYNLTELSLLFYCRDFLKVRRCHLLTEGVKALIFCIFLLSSAKRRIINFVLRIFLPVAVLYLTRALLTAKIWEVKHKLAYCVIFSFQNIS
jgi:hypothetical protein